MRKLNLILLLLFYCLGCTKKIPERLPSSYIGQDVDVQFIKTPNRVSQSLDILNLINNSANYGFWMNYTLNGSGTAVLRNKTKAESLPNQFTRTLSLYDLYFSHGVKGLENSGQDQNHYLWFYTPLENFNFINTQEEFEFPFSGEIMDYAQKIFPIITRQIFKKLSPDNYVIDKYGTTLFKDEFRKLIFTEYKKRLRKNWEDIFLHNDEENSSSLVKLNAYRKAFSPLSSFFELNIDKDKGSYKNIRILLPGPSTINGLETKNINKIKINPGLDIKLKKPLVGKLITIKGIRYLDKNQKDPSLLENKVMQVDVHKNFKYRDQMNFTVTFGSINPDLTPEKIYYRKKDKKILKALPLNSTDRSAALILDGMIHLKKSPFKRINKYLGEFKVITYIHQISLTLKRDKKTKSFQKAFQEYPTYLMDINSNRSKISIRMLKGVNKIIDSKFLMSLGFKCISGREKENDPEIKELKKFKYVCGSDLANFKDFEAYYKSKFGNRIKRKLLDITSIVEARALLEGIDSIKPEEMFDHGMPYELFKIIQTYADAWDKLRKIDP